MTRAQQLRATEARLREISDEQHMLAVEREHLRELATTLRLAFTAADAAQYAELARPNVWDPV